MPTSVSLIQAYTNEVLGNLVLAKRFRETSGSIFLTIAEGQVESMKRIILDEKLKRLKKLMNDEVELLDNGENEVMMKTPSFITEDDEEALTDRLPKGSWFEGDFIVMRLR